MDTPPQKTANGFSDVSCFTKREEAFETVVLGDPNLDETAADMTIMSASSFLAPPSSLPRSSRTGVCAVGDPNLDETASMDISVAPPSLVQLNADSAAGDPNDGNSDLNDTIKLFDDTRKKEGGETQEKKLAEFDFDRTAVHIDETQLFLDEVEALTPSKEPEAHRSEVQQLMSDSLAEFEQLEREMSVLIRSERGNTTMSQPTIPEEDEESVKSLSEENDKDIYTTDSQLFIKSQADECGVIHGETSSLASPRNEKSVIDDEEVSMLYTPISRISKELDNNGSSSILPAAPGELTPSTADPSADLNHRLEDYAQQVSNLTSDLEKTKTELEHAKKEKEDYTFLFEDTKKKLHETNKKLTAQIMDLECQLESAKEFQQSNSMTLLEEKDVEIKTLISEMKTVEDKHIEDVRKLQNENDELIQKFEEEKVELLATNAELRTQISDFEQKIACAQANIVKLESSSTEATKLLEAIERLQNENGELSCKLNERTNSFNTIQDELESRIDDLNRQLAVALSESERWRSAPSQISALTDANERLLKENDELKRTLEEQKSLFASTTKEMQAQILESQEEVKSVREEIEKFRMTAEENESLKTSLANLEALKNEKDDYVVALNDATNLIDELKQQLHTKERQLENELQSCRDAYEEKAAKREEDLTTASELLKSAKFEIETVKEQLKVHATDKEALKTKYESCQLLVSQLQEELDSSKKALESQLEAEQKYKDEIVALNEKNAAHQEVLAENARLTAELSRVVEEAQAMQAENEALKLTEQESRREIADISSKLTVNQSSLNACQTDLSVIRKELSSVMCERDSAIAALDAKQQVAQDVIKEMERIMISNTTSESDKVTIAELRQRVASLEKELDAAMAIAAQMSSQPVNMDLTTRLEPHLDMMKQLKDDVKCELAQLRSTVLTDQSKSELDALKARILELEKENEDLASASSMKNATSAVPVLVTNTELMEMREQLESQSAEIERCHKLLDEVDELEEEKNKEISTLKNEIQLLKIATGQAKPEMPKTIVQAAPLLAALKQDVRPLSPNTSVVNKTGTVVTERSPAPDQENKANVTLAGAESFYKKKIATPGRVQGEKSERCQQQ